ncbi:MAG: pseudouridine synthase [Betaproteobacteria bacterium]|nr:pseudouridine synthase [Betaproteobacteria bacterium]
MMRQGEEAKSGQFAEALGSRAKPIKRERLHKLLAQSGHGSRRDMEILIASGRVMINGNVATAGAHVSPGDKVLIDHRLVPIKFTPDVPRVLLYHKPEGEIVSNADPGNRISVFDNLPRVENGKWIAIGRLDFNTSGLLIFTTSGDLANKMMHPRFEVEREYAVRLLGELTEEQTRRLLDGIDIDGVGGDEDDEDDEFFDGDADEQGAPHASERRPARFTFIEKRAGPDPDKTSANNWYHVIIKEGRNREVRRMFEALGLTVSRLMRVRFGKVELPPQLKRGGMHELDVGQVKDLLLWAGVSTEGMDFNAPRPQQKPGRGGARQGAHQGARPQSRPQKPPKRGPRGAPRPPREGMEGRGEPAGVSPPPVGTSEGDAGQPAGGNAPGRRKSRGRKGQRPAPVAGAKAGQPRERRGRKSGQGGGQQPGLPGQGKQAGNRRNKKSRKGAGRAAEPREPRSLRAEPMVAWTGQPITGSGRRGEGRAARQPRIIRTVTRRPRLPETEGES